MCLVHQYVHYVEVLQENGLQYFYDVGLVSKHAHFEYDMFVKTLFCLYFHLINFIIGPV